MPALGDEMHTKIIISLYTGTRSPAVAGMADSWRQINLLDFHFRDLAMTPSRSSLFADSESPISNSQ
jgi:hypothetical protein